LHETDDLSDRVLGNTIRMATIRADHVCKALEQAQSTESWCLTRRVDPIFRALEQSRNTEIESQYLIRAYPIVRAQE
jgi:hypothetical protein